MMTSPSLHFSRRLTPSDPSVTPVLIVGHLRNLSKISYDDVKMKFGDKVSEETFSVGVSGLRPSPTDSVSLYLNHATVAALPVKCSRHNTPSHAHTLSKLVRSCLSVGHEFIVLVCEARDCLASACAVARAAPLFTRKSSSSSVKRSVTVEFLVVGDVQLTEADVQCLTDAADSVRLAARITDTPCSEMNTDDFIEEIRRVGQKLNIEAVVIQGDELKERGLGGLYAVGKAARGKPALVVLSHKPEGATKTIAWVGKGIVYDTGGLSIKGKTTMPGMKRDCGGAAAVLGAFYLSLKQGFSENLHAVFCLAENAVGPDSLRPDDIITMYSNKTVEVNNTDAEGRLVLADGVSYASKELGAEVIVDMATLTGAQGLATGRYHGALVTNRADWEEQCVSAGRVSGDLLHPLVYCPELHAAEFTSAVADMKNSSADRSNAEVSCAGLFIASHLGFDFAGVWLHIDMAYPVHTGERSTGYGVALLPSIFSHLSGSFLIQSLAPPTNLIDSSTTNHTPQSTNKKIRLH